jgi:hypothetical protein
MQMCYRIFIIWVGAVLGLWIIMLPESGICYNPIPAELTSNAYLRQHPKKNGNIMILLIKGSNVTIHDENGPWAKVVYETHMKKYGNLTGWVSRQYLNALSTPSVPAVVALSPAVSTAGATDTATAAHSVGNAPQIARNDSPANSVSVSSAPASMAQETEKQEPIVSAPLPPAIHKSYSMPFSVDDVAAFFRKSKQTQTAGAETLMPETGAEKVSTYDVIKILTRLLFEFSMVCISCMALVFSYSAIRVARSMHSAITG